MEKKTESDSKSSSRTTSKTSSVTSDTSSDVTAKFPKKSESVSMDKLEKYRVQWWNQGNIHPMAEWNKIKLPYILVKDVTIDKYEEHAD